MILFSSSLLVRAVFEKLALPSPVPGGAVAGRTRQHRGPSRLSRLLEAVLSTAARALPRNGTVLGAAPGAPLFAIQSIARCGK